MDRCPLKTFGHEGPVLDIIQHFTLKFSGLGDKLYFCIQVLIHFLL